LAIALSLSNKGTNAKLLSCINDCFESHPELQKNSRFSGLFTHKGSSGHRNTCNTHGYVQEHPHPALPVLGQASTMNMIPPPINFGDHRSHPIPPINYQAHTLNDIMLSYPDWQHWQSLPNSLTQFNNSNQP
ncbi:hypothetical protein BJV74DRAFT_763261, partial [Russula compacta]